MKRILGINPHFYDFSAYDFWAKPVGFLYLISILKNLGFSVDFIDCLDRQHLALAGFSGRFEKTRAFGTGHYYFEKAKKPAVLAKIPMHYKRYGLPEKIFRAELAKIKPPDLILVTSLMTYWYSGVFEAIRILKEIFPAVPVVLGGTYPTLMPEHARKNSGADLVFENRELPEFFNYLEKNLGPFKNKPPKDFSEFPCPDFSFYKKPDYVILKTGEGCPFNCTYCAVRQISPKFIKKPLPTIISEIEFFAASGIKNIAFYDDALLYPSEYFEKLLEEIKNRRWKVFFHTANGLQAKFVTEKIARLMKENNFILPRLSLETINAGRQQKTGGKVTIADFEKAVNFFQAAGYQQGEVGVYLLCGLPGQSFEEVAGSIEYARGLGLRITLAEFSPVPGTVEWEKSPLKDADPLLHNNSVFSLLTNLPNLQKLKDLVKAANSARFSLLDAHLK